MELSGAFLRSTLPEILTQLLSQPARNDRLAIGADWGLRENSSGRLCGFGGVWGPST
jgi:hypothetical protein